MHLAVNSQVVAGIAATPVSLERLVGAYELVFPLQAKVHPKSPTSWYWLTLYGARVYVRPGAGAREVLGDAWPSQPICLKQAENPGDYQFSLKLVLQPIQLAKIEELRDGGDLAFELGFEGIGGKLDQPGFDSPVRDEFRISTPKSEWTNRLRQAGALDILLLEVPFPLADQTEEGALIIDHLRAAQGHFVDRNYKSCIADCREILEALSKGEPNPLKRLSSEQKEEMTKPEREAAIFSVIRHYTQLGHHSVQNGKKVEFSREEAKFLLQLAAVCAGFRRAPLNLGGLTATEN